jgi:hypothetical protein
MKEGLRGYDPGLQKTKYAKFWMEIRVMWMISMKCFELDGQSQITNGIK